MSQIELFGAARLQYVWGQGSYFEKAGMPIVKYGSGSLMFEVASTSHVKARGNSSKDKHVLTQQ